ncbi:hypothetical protein [Congzhengia sp.]
MGVIFSKTDNKHAIEPDELFTTAKAASYIDVCKGWQEEFI